MISTTKWDKIIDLAEKKGANEVEVYSSTIDSKQVRFTDKLSSNSISFGTGVGIRVIINKKIGFFSTTKNSEDDLKSALLKAISIAKVCNQDKEWVSLPEKFGKAAVEKIYDKKIDNIQPETIIEAANIVIDGVHDYNKKVKPTRGFIITSKLKTFICNNFGGSIEREETFASLQLSVQAEDGTKVGVSDEGCSARTWDEMKFEEAPKIASERAIKMLEARPIPSGETQIVFRNVVFAEILDTMLGSTLTAETIQKNRSPWIGKIGKKIASNEVNLYDDGTRIAGIGTREFDDEGIPQQKTFLIQKGILKSYLYDTYTAKKDKRLSTGNASRTYNHSPRPSPNNLVLEEGQLSFEEIINETRSGIYVCDVIGEWLSNPLSGDFSSTVTNGFLIKNGEIKEAIKGIMVSKNFFELINGGIDYIANDLKNSGNVYSPSIRVQNVKLTGG